MAFVEGAEDSKSPRPPSREAIYNEQAYKSPSKKKDGVKDTVLGFADAFTAHGVHYIFEKEQTSLCRMFWVLVVSIAGILAILM